jgi:hypothetical protein
MCFGITQQTSGSVVVFNSQQGYDLVAPTFGISTLDYALDSYSGVYTSISGGQDDTAWEIEAASGIEGSFGEWVSSVGLGDSLTVEFFSDSVYSVGGVFHVLNAQNESVAGIMRLTLSDGTTYFNQLDSGGNYAAFLSSEINITSLTVYAFGDGELESAGISRLSVGVIPAPATVLAFTLGAAFRRRRA